MQDAKEHWERVYKEKSDAQISWYQASPDLSLGLIAACEVDSAAGIIDVGGGTSRLVDGLLHRGYSDVTVLDISEQALTRAQQRLGPSGTHVEWLLQDVTSFQPKREWAVWHDRAVFHFLTDADLRRRYREALEVAVATRGHVIMATFAMTGPPSCSGRSVMRYTPESLLTELGPRFDLVQSEEEQHMTPAGNIQDFIYCRFRVCGRDRR